MTTLTVTAKGQISLRKEVLQHLGIQPGSKITVHKLPGGKIEIEAEKSRGKISDVFGLLKRDGREPVSIEDMNDAIAEGWAGHS
jgi:AbrB family looped-hinge helix DNA binding protein